MGGKDTRSELKAIAINKKLKLKATKNHNSINCNLNEALNLVSSNGYKQVNN